MTSTITIRVDVDTLEKVRTIAKEKDYRGKSK